MKIELRDVGKRYRHEWVLRRLTYDLLPGSSHAVLGPNGSGKSTLLRILAGHLSPSRGQLSFLLHGQRIAPGEVYRHISMAAPYIDLIEEFTLEEAIRFHLRFKPLATGLRPEDLPALLQLDHARDKPILHFSSGMQQRLKLGLAICVQTPVLLLDEPTTTLDTAGATWYQDLLQQYAADRLVIIASNVAEDYRFCQQQLSVLAYK